jgi:hypothetical protein
MSEPRPAGDADPSAGGDGLQPGMTVWLSRQ